MTWCVLLLHKNEATSYLFKLFLPPVGVNKAHLSYSTVLNLTRWASEDTSETYIKFPAGIINALMTLFTAYQDIFPLAARCLRQLAARAAVPDKDQSSGNTTGAGEVRRRAVASNSGD